MQETCDPFNYNSEKCESIKEKKNVETEKGEQ